MRKAIIRNNDGFVVNVIEIKQNANWQPPDGCSLITAGKSSPGDTWDGKQFVTPEPVISEPIRDLAAEIDALNAKIGELEKR